MSTATLRSTDRWNLRDDWTMPGQDGSRLLRYMLRSSSLPILLGLLNTLVLSKVLLDSGSYAEVLRILVVQALLFAIVGLLFLHRQQCLLGAVITQGIATRRLAESDALTGLANRRGLETEFARRIAAGEQVTLLFIDLDDFKSVNDRLGHEAGDALLQETARRLKRACGERAFVSRHGGDEFLVLTHVADLGDITGMARRIRDELTLPFTWSPEGAITARASLGAAIGAGRSEPLEDLIARADHALYAAKATGEGSCVVATQQRANLRPRSPR